MCICVPLDVRKYVYVRSTCQAVRCAYTRIHTQLDLVAGHRVPSTCGTDCPAYKQPSPTRILCKLCIKPPNLHAVPLLHVGTVPEPGFEAVAWECRHCLPSPAKAIRAGMERHIELYLSLSLCLLPPGLRGGSAPRPIGPPKVFVGTFGGNSTLSSSSQAMRGRLDPPASWPPKFHGVFRGCESLLFSGAFFPGKHSTTLGHP